MLTPGEQFDIEMLSENALVAEPRSAAEIDHWFTAKPKRKRWKAAETNEWRLRLAIDGAPENREALLRPFIEKKPSRVPFNTAHVAAVLGTDEALALARERKADFGAVWGKQTPLHIAAKLGHGELVRQLLDEGCPYVDQPYSPLQGALGRGHDHIIELLKERAVPKDFERAAQVGDNFALRAMKGVVEPGRFHCKDEATARFLLEHFPEVSPANLSCGVPVGKTLAEAIVAVHPKLRAEDIAPQLIRMQLDGLRVLFDACEDLGEAFESAGKSTTLAETVARGPRVDVLQELVARGFRPPSDFQPSSFADAEMTTYLASLAGGPQWEPLTLVNREWLKLDELLTSLDRHDELLGVRLGMSREDVRALGADESRLRLEFGRGGLVVEASVAWGGSSREKDHPVIVEALTRKHGKPTETGKVWGSPFARFEADSGVLTVSTEYLKGAEDTRTTLTLSGSANP